MIATLLTLWLVASFPLGILTGRFIRHAHRVQQRAQRQADRGGFVSSHFGGVL